MAREEREERGRGKGSGVSLEFDDKIAVGLFGPGEAKIVESIFADYNYGGNTKAIPVWLITYERDGEKYEQPYSVGSGWRVSSDGESLIPKNGQTGLPDSCNAMLLVESLKEAGYPKGKLGANPRNLEGGVFILKREAQPDRGLDAAPRKGQSERKGPKTILLVEEIVKLPWETTKGKGTASKKAKDEDEDEEDEKPRRKAKASRDDEDEDEPKPKKKAARDDDEDETSDEDILEASVEAIIEVCEKEKGPVPVDDLEGLIVTLLKGNPDRKKIAAKAVEIADEAKGWTYNKKKQTVEAED